MELTLKIKCECGVEKEIPILNTDEGSGATHDLTGSIEQHSDGLFYCLHNSSSAFQLVCVSCGKEKPVSY